MTPSSTKTPAAWTILLAFAVIYVSWGTTYFAIKLGVQTERLPPWLFGGVRFTLAGLIVLGWQALRGQSIRLGWRDAARMAGISVLLFVAGNGFVTVAQRHIDSSLAAVLVATTPLWMGLFAMLWPHGDRLSARGWLGLLIGLSGVVVLLEPQLRSVTGADRFGVLCVLAAAACWALGSLFLRQLRVPTPRLTAAGYQMLLGGIMLSALGSASGELHQLPPRITPGALAVFTYLLLVGSLAGFIAYHFLLGHVTAAKVGTYAYVNPVVAMVIGWAAGEAVTSRLWVAIGIILFAVFLVRRGERPVAASSAPAATGDPRLETQPAKA